MEVKVSMENSEAGYKSVSIYSNSGIILEEVTDRTNLREACKTVQKNKGAPGIDGVTVLEYACMRETKGYKELSQIIDAGKYRPKPVKRVYIPKANGDKRPLGIPTVEDRVVQQAIANVLSDFYDEKFSDNSFGYRPNRGCRDAIRRAIKYANEGREWIIDLDLSKFFDTVNHSKLLQVLSKDIKDGRVISLIHRFLRAPVSENGKVSEKTKLGTPQGGPMSPILANIILNECDEMMDKAGIKFVRYADDMMIFCTSKKAAERTLNRVTKFLEDKLFLKVNKEKTKILNYSKGTQFLGFSLTKRVPKHIKETCPRCTIYVTVHQKKREKFIKEMKETLDRRAPGGIEATMNRYNRKLRGWHNYFKGGIPQIWMKRTDAWLRRRIRQLYWKQWKKPSRRLEEFKRLNPKSPKLGEYAYSSNSYWRMSKTKQINSTLTNSTLFNIGWLTLSELNTQYVAKMSRND